MVFRNIPEMPDIGSVTWFMELERGLEFFDIPGKKTPKNN